MLRLTLAVLCLSVIYVRLCDAKKPSCDGEEIDVPGGASLRALCPKKVIQQAVKSIKLKDKRKTRERLSGMSRSSSESSESTKSTESSEGHGSSEKHARQKLNGSGGSHGDKKGSAKGGRDRRKANGPNGQSVNTGGNGKFAQSREKSFETQPSAEPSVEIVEESEATVEESDESVSEESEASQEKKKKDKKPKSEEEKQFKPHPNDKTHSMGKGKHGNKGKGQNKEERFYRDKVEAAVSVISQKQATTCAAQLCKLQRLAVRGLRKGGKKCHAANSDSGQVLTLLMNSAAAVKESVRECLHGKTHHGLGQDGDGISREHWMGKGKHGNKGKGKQPEKKKQKCDSSRDKFSTISEVCTEGLVAASKAGIVGSCEMNLSIKKAIGIALVKIQNVRRGKKWKDVLNTLSESALNGELIPVPTDGAEGLEAVEDAEELNCEDGLSSSTAPTPVETTEEEVTSAEPTETTEEPTETEAPTEEPSVPLTTPPGEAVDSCYQLVADVVVVLDSSGSVGIDNFNTCLEFVTRAADAFTIAEDRSHFSVVLFDSWATILEFNLDDFYTADQIIYMTDSIYEFPSDRSAIAVDMRAEGTQFVSVYIGPDPSVYKIAYDPIDFPDTTEEQVQQQNDWVDEWFYNVTIQMTKFAGSEDRAFGPGGFDDLVNQLGIDIMNKLCISAAE